MISFDEFFRSTTGHEAPRSWQKSLAEAEFCVNRCIRIPTGFGKTQGVLAAWIWHRVVCNDQKWPRRLVWCLPMRVLVEQTESEVRSALNAAGLLWEGGDHTGKVGVHLLMGGADGGCWQLYPEEPAVLIGTQDMLLSRALNRGYGAPRARWPMEFGLLNQDALWVMDEIQLMDVGLATSAQLQAFRGDDEADANFSLPCRTWWMSATLQADWLKKSPDTLKMTNGIAQTSIPGSDRCGHLWEDVQKPFEVVEVKDASDLAALISREHRARENWMAGPTLVVVNTVKTAVALFEALKKDRDLRSADIKLVHSRFRPAERAPWRECFLNRAACESGIDRIIVSTQVVEAGVDISAGLLVTELAPWANLVQRFGRCARWGGKARVIVADQMAGQAKEAGEKAACEWEKAVKSQKSKEIDFQAIREAAEIKAALPYPVEELRSARHAMRLIEGLSPLDLEKFEERHKELLPGLYPYQPLHLLLRRELDDLFDTTPDLSGSDIDISRFIRSGVERDLQVFWEEIGEKDKPPETIRPVRDALCSVPFFSAQKWLCGSGNRLEKGKRAWVWDWLEGTWRLVEKGDFFPGQTVLVSAECGGYDLEKGWHEKSTSRVLPVCHSAPDFSERADSGQDDDSTSVAGWQTIASHGFEVGNRAKKIGSDTLAEYSNLFDLAGRWHDVGKSHEAFQILISHACRPRRNDLAKAPEQAWAKQTRRRGFRHELASVLALFDLLCRHAPDHPALLGPWRELLASAGMSCSASPTSTLPPSEIEQEILDLSADHFNLLSYLVCAHHGKVRLTWHACPADQESTEGTPRIRGVREGDKLPSLPLFTAAGTSSQLPGSVLNLAPASAGVNSATGSGWTERALTLQKALGPFRLAWCEAVLRAADQYVSATSDSIDCLLGEEDRS